MSDDVQYTEDGPKGKSCKECKSYEPNKDEPEKGKCAGFDVIAKASCNYFEKKEEKQ